MYFEATSPLALVYYTPMALYIVVKTGEKAGLYFEIKANLKFGRRNADFLLEGKAASSQHAQIKQISTHEYVLVDLKSKNGIKINGLREYEVLLRPGLQFTLGSTTFEVVEKGGEAQPPSSPPPPPPPPETHVNRSPNSSTQVTSAIDTAIDESTLLTKSILDHTASVRRKVRNNDLAAPPPLAPPLPPLSNVKPSAPRQDSTENLDESKFLDIVVNESWYEVLENFATSTLPQIKNSPQKVAPFNPGLRLQFLRGVQVNTEWILGYGPRLVGADEYDLTIFEPEAPANCFQLLPTNLGVNFKTSHPDKVLYNGRSLQEALVKQGDKITIGNTLIRIEFIE